MCPRRIRGRPSRRNSRAAARPGRHTPAMGAEITRVNPEQLHDTPGYHHVTVVEPARMAYLAGQCPLDRSGTVVGLGDVVAQVDRVAANALTALAAAGATPDRVVRSVIYVVTDDNAVLAQVWRRFTGSVIGPAFTSARTLLRVAPLGVTGQLLALGPPPPLPG